MPDKRDDLRAFIRAEFGPDLEPWQEDEIMRTTIIPGTYTAACRFNPHIGWPAGPVQAPTPVDRLRKTWAERRAGRGR